MKMPIFLIVLTSCLALAQPEADERADSAVEDAQNGATPNRVKPEHTRHSGFGPEYLAELTPIIVPLGSFALALSIVALTLFSGLRKEKERHQTMRLLIEKGMTVPPDLLLTPKRPHSDLRSGLIAIAIGMGVMAMLALLPGADGTWAAGLIPLLVGLARLINWKFENTARRVA